VSKRSKRRQGGHAREGTEAGDRPAGRDAGSRAGGRDAGSRAGDRDAGSRAAAGGRGASGRTAPRDAGGRGASGRTAPRDAGGRAASAPAAASGWGLGVQLAFLVAVFAVVVLVAELAGAANLGVALGVGQIAFAIAVIYLLVRR
jgi:hypothetical protein